MSDTRLDLKIRLFEQCYNLTNSPPWEKTHEELVASRIIKLPEPLMSLFLGRKLPMARVEDWLIAGGEGMIDATLYAAHEDRGGPLIVYYHGGGWVQGSLEDYDRVCRRIAAATHAIVLSVDYRLAPEHTFPAAHDDALAAFSWAHMHARELGADPDKILVMGDSAGANLAASVCRQTLAADHPTPRGQVLIYPVTDATLSHPSYKTFANAPVLPTRKVEFFHETYLGDREKYERDDRVSPLLATNHEGLPPALLVTAAVDPLHDEGAAYAEAMREDGVEVEYHDIPNTIHGFFNVPNWCPGCEETLTMTAAFLQRCVG